MADVRKNPEDLAKGGLSATYHSGLLTTDTYLIANNGRVVLHFKKSGAGACTVTIPTPGSVDDSLAIADRTVSVPATNGDVFIGPLKPRHYNDAVGDLRITLSEVTGLTFAVLRMS